MAGSRGEICDNSIYCLGYNTIDNSRSVICHLHIILWAEVVYVIKCPDYNNQWFAVLWIRRNSSNLPTAQ